MRIHSINELTEFGQILDSDGVTALANSYCGIEDLTGNVREQIQLDAPKTTHMVTMLATSGTFVKESGYLSVDGVLYTVDYKRDPRRPRPGMWTEVFCHAERANS